MSERRPHRAIEPSSHRPGRFCPTLALHGRLATAREELELLDDPEHLGALPGFYMALHTWNRILGICPHLHVLSTIGGLAEDGTWKKPRRQRLLRADDPKRVFRRRFCDGFKKLLDQGKFQMPPDMTENDAHIRPSTTIPASFESEVWLFGSRAKGSPREDSDWDLLVVLPDEVSDEQMFADNPPSKFGRITNINVDIIYCNETEFSESTSVPNTLAYEVARTGVEIA